MVHRKKEASGIWILDNWAQQVYFKIYLIPPEKKIPLKIVKLSKT